MSNKQESLRVAIIQAAPVYLDLQRSVVKATELIREAAGKGAQLVAFGETWLPGYPAWFDYCPDAALWNHEPTKEVFATLRRNSVVIPGNETERLAKVASETGVVIAMGLNERIDRGPGNGTLYNSLLFFDGSGKIVHHHRKLVPTYTERMIWGPGDARGLKAAETKPVRLGGLICWEHWMPVGRHVLHTSGEEVHVAVWPTVHEMHQIASRHYAFEGRCFVLAAGLIMRVEDLPVQLQRPANLPGPFLLRGGSAIIAPDGSYVVEPVFEKETILVADLDLNRIDKEKMTLDVSGHYFRPDLFEVRVRRKRQR